MNIFLEMRRPRNRRLTTEQLREIQQNSQRTVDERRRLELESRLYKKWRNGFCEDSILLDSKSDHEALAKMNWLDKQVATQLELEQERRENEDRQLRLHEASVKQQQYLQQRRVERDDEIKELNVFQDKHVAELRQRDMEVQKLRTEESCLKIRQQEITEEYANLEVNVQRRKERIGGAFNERRIKMMLRQRSEAIRQDLRDDIELLARISVGCTNAQISQLREKFEMQYDQEIQKQSQIEAMYESEAKESLIKQEQLWDREAMARERLLKQIIGEQLQAVDEQLAHNVQRQKSTVDIAESHLTAIENSNLRLKGLRANHTTDDEIMEMRSTETTPRSVVEKIDQLQISTSPDLFAPRYGKKKVAWN